MRVAVVDDGGPVGAATAAGVRAHGHEAFVVSASSGVDVLTGDGLSEALQDCSAVIDLLGRSPLNTGTVSEDLGFVVDVEAFTGTLCRATANLLAAEAAAGVRHHVALSEVGVERLTDTGYFPALAARETLIRQSGLPYSVIRATQLFESALDIAESATEDEAVWVTPVPARPVAGADVAAFVAHTAVFAPLQGVREVAGPDRLRLDTFVRAALAATGDRRRVFTDTRSTYFDARVRHEDLLPGADAVITGTHYSSWLADRPVTAGR